ncbi:MAG: glucosamine-6-phosphate deaminase [Candidatus Sericytochromatia bacterium]
MRLHVLADHQAVSQALADRLLAFVEARPRAVLALPSGNTPKALYRLLAPHAAAFAGVTVFALDEYLGLEPDDPRSFRAFFEAHVFGPLALPPERAFVLDGRSAAPEAEAARYEAAIAAAGGLDLTVLGLGANGHIAFNEPGEALQARTHTATLQPPANEVAPRALTMGVGTLLAAPQVWLMATGEGKAEAAAAMRSGLITPRCPASLLQAHPGAEVFLDEAATALFPR